MKRQYGVDKHSTGSHRTHDRGTLWGKHKLSMNVAKNDYLCERKKIDFLHRPHLEIILVESMQEQKFETCNRKLKRIFL